MVKSKEDLKKALAETFNEMTRFTEVTSESTPEDLSDTLARMICNKTSRQDVNETSSQDATSIKGKVVDDSEIGDGKALTYSRVKDKIVYKRLGGGRGGGVVVEGTTRPELLCCNAIVFRPDPTIEYYQSWQVVGKHFTFIAEGAIADIVLQATITALGVVGAKKICITDPQTWTATILVTLAAGYSLTITGIGKETVISGSIEVMLDITNVAFIQGDNWASLTLENLHFKHNTQSADSIGLDLLWGNVNLRNIIVENTSQTGQGIGITIGRIDEVGQNPGQAYWESVEVLDYNYNFNIGLDHINATRLNSVRPVSRGFNFHGCYDSLWDGLFVLNPVAGCVPFYFYKINGSFQMRNLHVEGAQNPTTLLFYQTVWRKVSIYEIDSSTTAGITVASFDYNFYIRNLHGNLKNEVEGGVTILNAAVTGTIAHGMLSAPNIVLLGATHAEVADAIWSSDGVNITITVPIAVTANRIVSVLGKIKYA